MSEAPAPDYALLDRIGAGAWMFYPRRVPVPPPPGARDIFIDVTDAFQVANRFYPLDPSQPTVLLFHGNGEVAADYDSVVQFYHGNGLNLWVADYRGYGLSNGHPTFESLMSDAHPVLDRFHAELDQDGFAEKRIVFGRSLCAFPATELAARRPERLRGLVVESGATSLDRMTRMAGSQPGAAELAAAHRAKLAGIRLPTLVIHGERDELIPVETALAFYDALDVTPKEICIIPGAGHNDLWWLGLDQYFAALKDFVQALA